MHRGAATTRKLGELPAPKALLPTPDMCPSTQAGTRAHMHVHMQALLTHMSMCAPTHAVHMWVRTLQAHARVQTHAKARASARGHTVRVCSHAHTRVHTGTRVLMQRTHAHAQETALSGVAGATGRTEPPSPSARLGQPPSPPHIHPSVRRGDSTPHAGRAGE